MLKTLRDNLTLYYISKLVSTQFSPGRNFTHYFAKK